MTIKQRQWVSVIVGLAAIGLGIWILGKPYLSLENLPLLLLFSALFLLIWRGAYTHRAMIGVVVLVVAFGALISEQLSIALLIYGVVAWMLARGVVGILAVRRSDWFSVMRGISLFLLGLMSAYWLDATSIMVGLLIAPVLIGAGGITITRVWKPRNSPGRTHPRWAVAGRIGSVLLLLVTALATVGSVIAISTAPALDDFADYADSPGDTPGVLLRSEPLETGMPENAVATRILYTTTDMDGQIALATGIVIVPATVPAEPMPVVLWAHGTTGINIHCAPTSLKNPLVAGAMLFPEEPLSQGWAIVAPDYLGLGASEPHPYLVGKPAAHSSLDAVRAARQLDSISLSDQTVVWGHSQGGGASLWIGIEAPEYAPDVPLLGVAALAPASDLPGLIDTLLPTIAGPLFGGYIIYGFSGAYDDVAANEYIRPGARFSQKKVSERCLSEPSILVSFVSVLVREPFTQGDLDAGPFHDRLVENVPSLPLGVPVFIGQGEADPLILPEIQSAYVQDLCEAGEIVEYHTYPDLDHMGVVTAESPMIPDLMEWTKARIEGNAPINSCN